MKKSLYSFIALGALASAAQAQTVTVYGNIDPAIMTQSKTGATGAGGRETSMVDGSMKVFLSLYGFRGTEDLGGGLTAGFVLEGGFSSLNGSHANPGVYQTQTFGREAKVNVGRRLGQDWRRFATRSRAARFYLDRAASGYAILQQPGFVDTDYAGQ